jgi:hypothetical protein
VTATPAEKRGERRLVGGVVLVAVLVRVVVLLSFPSVFAFDRTGAIHGSEAYDTYARNLHSTGVYGLRPAVPDAVLPPLYGVLLAAVYAIAGRGFLGVAALQIALDAVSIVTLVAIGRRLMPSGLAVGLLAGPPSGLAVGLLAGLFFGLYPYLVFQGLVLSDTTFFTLLLHLFIFSAVLLWERPTHTPRTWALASLGGLALGCATLTRPIMVPLAGLVGVWFLLRYDVRETVARLLPMAVAALATVAPWVIRNYVELHAVVPISTSMGSNFWQGNNPSTLRLLREGYDVQWASPTVSIPDGQVLERDAALLDTSLRYLREHPEQIPELLWVKFRTQWSIDVTPRRNPLPGVGLAADALHGATGAPDPPAAVARYSAPLFDRIGRTAHRLYWGSLLMLGVAGMVLVSPAWRRVALLYFVQASMTLVYVTFHPSTRYRAPTDPLFFLFSAFTLVWLWHRSRGGISPVGAR